MINILSWVAYSIRLLSLIILTPMIISNLSKGDISLWYLFNNIIQFLVLLDLGFTPVFSRFYSYYNDKYECLMRIRKINLKFNILLVVVGSVIGWLGISIYFNHADFSFNKEIGYNSYVICLLLSFLFLIHGNYYRSFIEGTNNLKFLRAVEIIVAIIQVVFSIAVFIFGWEYIYIIIIQPISYFIQLMIYYFVVERINRIKRGSLIERNEIVTLNHQKIDEISSKDILFQSIKTSISYISNLGVFYYMLFSVVRNDAENSAVILFSINIVRVVFSFSQVPVINLYPTLCYKVKNAIPYKKDILYIYVSFFVLSLLGFLSLVSLGEPLLRMIKSNVELLPTSLLLLVFTGILCEQINSIYLQLMLAKGIIINYISNVICALCLVFLFILFKNISHLNELLLFFVIMILCYGFIAPFVNGVLVRER